MTEDEAMRAGPGTGGAKHIALFLMPSAAGGGVTKSILTIAGLFAERGHRVDVVLARAKGPYLQNTPQSVRVIDLDTRTGLACVPLLLTAPKLLWTVAPLLLNPPKVLGSLPALVRYLRCERPAAMLSAKHHGNITALCAVQLAGVETRLVISQRTHHTSYVQEATKRRNHSVPRLTRRLYPWADGIVAVSDGVAEGLSVTAGIARERITTIYNPAVTRDVDEKARAPLNHPWFGQGSPPVLLGVGRLVTQKDFQTLLAAFARVRARRPARLMILGEGKERAALEASARKLGVAADVDLPGFVDNPFAYMARSAVFVLSSAYEGLPGALIQAMACGCPVVSTNCPSGPAEILDEGAYGRLVPVGDDEALASAILKTLEAPADPERLRMRAAAFSVDRAADRYLQILVGAQ